MMSLRKASGSGFRPSIRLQRYRAQCSAFPGAGTTPEQPLPAQDLCEWNEFAFRDMGEIVARSTLAGEGCNRNHGPLL